MEPADLEFLTRMIEKQGNLEKEIGYVEIERKHWRDECEKTRMKLDIAVKTLEKISASSDVNSDESALNAREALKQIRGEK